MNYNGNVWLGGIFLFGIILFCMYLITFIIVAIYNLKKLIRDTEKRNYKNE